MSHGTDAGADVEVLPVEPATKPLFAKAIAVSARRRGALSGQLVLPSRRIVVKDVRQDRDRLAAYSRVCGFTVHDWVPATWPQVLAFPLQLTLMTHDDFPFAPVGMIHVANSLSIRRRVGIAERLTLSVGAENLQPHRRGFTLDLISEARVGEELVWSGVSTYLARKPEPKGKSGEARSDHRDSAAAQEAASENATPNAAELEQRLVESLPIVGRWELPADLGRRYAAVSGDFNPIHLSALSARALGFPRAIAHGMWTTARSLALVQNRLPEAQQAVVSFHKPILLPGKVDVGLEGDSAGWRVEITSGGGSRIHFRGEFGYL